MIRKLLPLLTVLTIVLAPLAAWPQAVVRTVMLQNAAAATGNGTALDVSTAMIATLQVSGTFVGTVTYETSQDGANWSTLTCYPLGGSTGASTATAAAYVRCNVNGLVGIRARVSAYTSGSITVNATTTSLGFPFAATNN
jgi:hypothetical protein